MRADMGLVAIWIVLLIAAGASINLAAALLRLAG